VPRRLAVNGLTGRDPALEPAVVVPDGDRIALLAFDMVERLAVVKCPVLVALAPGHVHGVFAESELDARGRRDREHRLPSRDGGSRRSAGRRARGDAAALEVDGAADGVARLLIPFNQLLHLGGRLGVGTAHVVLLAVVEYLLEAHVVGLDVADLVHVGFDLHVVLGGVEHLLGDRAGRDPVHRLPGGGAPAAAPVARAELRG